MAAQRLKVLTGHLQTPQPTATRCSTKTEVAMSRSPITTHVLDTSRGQPATGVPVQLSYMDPNTHTWTMIASGTTNMDGRSSNLLTVEQLKAGTYRMHFDTAAYFAKLNNHKPFYPYVDVVFNLEDVTQHYHIPLLLSPFSYSTYRGS